MTTEEENINPENSSETEITEKKIKLPVFKIAVGIWNIAFIFCVILGIAVLVYVFAGLKEMESMPGFWLIMVVVLVVVGLPAFVAAAAIISMIWAGGLVLFKNLRIIKSSLQESQSAAQAEAKNASHKVTGVVAAFGILILLVFENTAEIILIILIIFVVWLVGLLLIAKLTKNKSEPDKESQNAAQVEVGENDF